MRKFKNVSFPLPDGQDMRIGTHLDKAGRVTIKLRLPGDYWNLAQLMRAAKGTAYKDGQAVSLIEQDG
jgi:hypothetical protein